MSVFEDIDADRVSGSLTMFDRLIFKGHLRRLYAPGAISAFLWSQGFPMKEPSRYAQEATATIRQREGYSRRVGASLYLPRPCHHPGQGPEQRRPRPPGRRRDGVTEGLVCVISIVEPAWSFDVRPDPATHWLVARPRQCKCGHHYLYLVDAELSFMHICTQSWLPYPIQIWVRERVARPSARRRRGRLPPPRKLLAAHR